MTTRVLIADDQELVRTGLRVILESRGFDVVAEATNGSDAVSLAQRLQPDVILMDIRMPVMDGIKATRRIDSSGVIILTTFDHDEYIVEALRAGASGFLLKDAPPDELVHAIDVVAEGSALLSPKVTKRLIENVMKNEAPPAQPPAEFEELTVREREVLQLVTAGMSNQEIAEAMNISETTVKTHVSHVLEKLNLRDRVQAVIMMYETGLVRSGRAGA